MSLVIVACVVSKSLLHGSNPPFVDTSGKSPLVLGDSGSIEVGEQTGALDNMLHKVGEFYDGEVENTVNNLTALLEPILTVVMGVMVGFMVICMYLPMFDYIKHVPTGGN